MPFLLIGGVGFVAGLVAGNGLEGTSRIVKWGVIGGAGYLAAKHYKLL